MNRERTAVGVVLACALGSTLAAAGALTGPTFGGFDTEAPAWAQATFALVLLANVAVLAVFWWRDWQFDGGAGLATVLVGLVDLAASELLHLFSGIQGVFRFGPRGLLLYAPRADVDLFLGSHPVFYLAIPGVLLLSVGAAYLDVSRLRRWSGDHVRLLLGLLVSVVVLELLSGEVSDAVSLAVLLLWHSLATIFLLPALLILALRVGQKRRRRERAWLAVSGLGAGLVLFARSGGSTLAECGNSWSTPLVYGFDWTALRWGWMDACNEAWFAPSKTVLAIGILLIVGGGTGWIVSGRSRGLPITRVYDD